MIIMSNSSQHASHAPISLPPCRDPAPSDTTPTPERRFSFAAHEAPASVRRWLGGPTAQFGLSRGRVKLPTHKTAGSDAEFRYTTKLIDPLFPRCSRTRKKKVGNQRSRNGLIFKVSRSSTDPSQSGFSLRVLNFKFSLSCAYRRSTSLEVFRKIQVDLERRELSGEHIVV